MSPCDALRAERDELLEALREIALLAEHNSFVAAALPAGERAMCVLGQNFVVIKDSARQAIARSEAFPLEVSGKDPPKAGA